MEAETEQGTAELCVVDEGLLALPRFVVPVHETEAEKEDTGA